MQILHYQCSVSEHFDIAVKDLYEFKPRGKAALALLELYPDSLQKAGNPFLNNAKSVEHITEAWVRSKKGKEPPGAAALFGILDCLQHLGFAARRELCAWLRMWIHRTIMIAKADHIVFSTTITTAQSRKLSAHVAAANTQTSGVLEQRLVDACASALYPERHIWKSKGLSDSVNTTNTSQKKLGDCEFQNSSNKVVQAFEAHGGKLSAIYIQEHLRTCLLYTSPSPRDQRGSRMPSSA